MSVLLVDPPPERGTAALRKLLDQGDEVRVVVEHDRSGLRAQGARVAIGDPADDDLIERAGQHARTIVLFDPDPPTLTAALTGAGRAGIERVVLVVEKAGSKTIELLEGGSPSYVVLRTGRRPFRRRSYSDEEVADAVDAADDLAGMVRLDLDLSRPESWTALGLVPR